MGGLFILICNRWCLSHIDALLFLIVLSGETEAGNEILLHRVLLQNQVFCNEILLELLLPLFFPVSNRGTYDIYVKCDGVGRCVGNYDNRGSFGELALMYNTPRAATITATSPGALWGLVSEIFFDLNVIKHCEQKPVF